MMHDNITHLIYDSIVDENAICHLAAAIAEHMHADANWMLIGTNGSAPPAAICIHGIDQDIVRSYEEIYHKYDPWLSVVDEIPNKIPTSLDRWVSSDNFRGSRIYQELIRGKIDIIHCMGLVFRHGQSQSTFAVQRGKRGPAFCEDDENLLKPYIDHLERFILSIYRKSKLMQTDLNNLVANPDPVIVVNEKCYPVHCSPDGSALIDLGTVISRTSSGRLRSIDNLLRLDAAVRLAVTRGVPTVKYVYPPCGRYIIAVDPCPSLNQHAVITVRNLEEHTRKKVNNASYSFRFTDAEKRLIISLINGSTIDEYCSTNGIAISTARSQIHSIFGKTGSESQSKLLTMILIAPTRAA